MATRKYTRRVRRNCVICGRFFSVFLSRIARGRGSCCSRACYYKRLEVPVEERFWKYVRKTRRCWLWIGAISSSGYGEIWRNGEPVGAHIVSYEMAYGPVPKGKLVCHTCDVRPCVRPKHLFSGTYTDNINDAVNKGRKPHVYRK